MTSRFRLRSAPVFLLASALTSCAVRNPEAPRNPAAEADRGSYIDLQPGWRISVITPLAKSGQPLLRASSEGSPTGGDENRLAFTMTAPPEFAGYEKSYYAVERRGRDGVRVRFTSAEIVVDGKSDPRSRPVISLFRIPREIRRLRLIYLVRASPADHNMAMVGAKDAASLATLTREVRADPARACRSANGRLCRWFPAGIAVRPEMKKSPGDNWIPAR